MTQPKMLVGRAGNVVVSAKIEKKFHWKKRCELKTLNRIKSVFQWSNHSSVCFRSIFEKKCTYRNQIIRKKNEKKKKNWWPWCDKLILWFCLKMIFEYWISANFNFFLHLFPMCWATFFAHNIWLAIYLLTRTATIESSI